MDLGNFGHVIRCLMNECESPNKKDRAILVYNKYCEKMQINGEVISPTELNGMDHEYEQYMTVFSGGKGKISIFY